MNWLSRGCNGSRIQLVSGVSQKQAQRRARVSAQIAGAVEQSAARIVQRCAVARRGRLLGDPATVGGEADAVSGEVAMVPVATGVPEYEVFDDTEFYEHVR